MPETMTRTLDQLFRDSVDPLPQIEDDSFGAYFDRFADARVVCLG